MSAKIEITGEFAGANRTDAIGWRKPEGDNQDLHLTFTIAKASDAPATQPYRSESAPIDAAVPGKPGRRFRPVLS